MFELGLFNAKMFFKIDCQHYYENNFIFGVDISSLGQHYLIHNDDENNESQEEFFQEHSLNIWLGLISFHIGFRGKSAQEKPHLMD